jgi:membrane protease YdiL (CAAX protease family)
MNAIKRMFWNDGQCRLRMVWRLLIQFNLFVTMLAGLAVIPKVLGESPASVVILASVYLAAGLALACLLARFIDHRPLADYGFHVTCRWWLDFGFGLFLGAALMTGIFLAERFAGWVRVQAPAVTTSGLAPVKALLLSIFFYVVVAFNEEFAFRGFQFRNLAEGLAGWRLGSRAALLCACAVSSAAFGLAHITNDNSTVLSTINIMLAGLLLSLPYLLTGELAVPIGMHTAWNLFQAAVFGFPVSGSAPKRRVLIPEQDGPVLWTGGDFGPEGGILATIALVVGCGLIALWV